MQSFISCRSFIGTSDESLLHLHDALRIQFEAVSKAYSESLHRLDQFCHQAASHNSSGGHGSGGSDRGGPKLNSLIHNLNDKLKGGGGSGSHGGGGQNLLKSPPVAQSHQVCSQASN